jgi:tRNA uridine 5-carbamoylmethylation protein Kti12
MDFIKSHHPELAMLLGVLRTTDLAKYEAAIQDVSKVIKRVEAARKRDQKIYELEIESWKIQSKIELLLAKGMAKDKSFNEHNLKQLLENRIDNQMQRTNREIELIDQRRASLVESMNKLNSTRQTQVEKQYANMLKRLKGDKIKVRDQEP